MWSFNRDGECDESLKQNNRDVLNIDPDERHRARRDLTDMAHSQYGVDAMKDQFNNTSAIDGVKDINASG
jgi:hypothetical protein